MTTLYPCHESAKKLLDNARTQINNAALYSNERKFVVQPIETTGRQSNKLFAWSLEQNAAASILERIALTKGIREHLIALGTYRILLFFTGGRS